MRVHQLRPVAAALALLAVAGTAIGCAGFPACRGKQAKNYFMVRYRVESVQQLTPRAEVREVKRFADMRPTWNTVAIRRPERCSNEGSGTGTGSLGQGTETVLGTDCGFWLAEIERGLANNKFSVVSWKSLEQVQSTKQVPTYVAARDLGADVVFMVNSLQHDTVTNGTFGQQSTARISFYRSNGDGDRLEPLPVSDAKSDRVKGFIQSRTKWMENKDWVFAIKAFLDVTAVDTRTGEAVWFYLKEESHPVPLKLDQRFLFRDEGEHWWPVTPKWLARMDREARVQQYSAERETTYSHDPTPASAYKHDIDELTRKVVDDFLSHFRTQGD